MTVSEAGMLHPEIERLDRDDILEIQRDKLVRLGKRLAGSLEWSAHFRAHGMNPRDLGDPQGFAAAPMLTAGDLEARAPFPMLTAQPHQVARFFAAFGGAGAPVLSGYTERDHDRTLARQMARLLHCVGVRPGDRAYQGYGYALDIEGAAFDAGFRALGATVFPVGPGREDLAAQWMRDLEWTVAALPLAGLSDLIRTARRQGVDPGRDWRLRRTLSVLEAGAVPDRDDFLEALPAGFAAHAVWGRTELGGPVLTVACPHARSEGEMHLFNEDSIVTEILTPDGRTPAGPGEEGELVVTTLDKEASPLVRFRTGALARLSDRPFDCACGRIGMPLVRIAVGAAQRNCP